MSQEYKEHGISELMEWRVGVPLAAASLLVGIRIVANAFSQTPWTLDRGFHLSIVSVFLVLELWSRRLIRKELKTFNYICDANGEIGIEAGPQQRLRGLVADLVSLYSSVIMMIVLAAMALQKI